MDLKQLMRAAQERPHLELLLLEAIGRDVPQAAELTPEAKLEAKQWFHRHDLIGEETLSGDYKLTYLGQELASELYRSRTNGERRWDLVTRALLLAAEEGAPTESVDRVDGVAVTDRERQIAFSRIESWNLGRLLTAWGGTVARIIPNSRASEALAVRGSLRDYFEPQGYSDHSVINTTNISGGNVGSVITGGSVNTMNVTQAITPLEATDINAKVDEILNALEGHGGVEDLTSSVEGIRNELASPNATKESLKEKVLSSISIAGDLSSVAQLVPLVAPVLPLLTQLASTLGG